jgi:hypothetical protein
VRPHLIERACAALAEGAANLVDLVGLMIERATYHEEHTVRPPTALISAIISAAGLPKTTSSI